MANPYKASVVVNKPVAEVFQFVATDYLKNHRRWAPRVVELHLDSPGVVAVGARGQEVRKQGGKNVTYAFEVTDLQLNKRIAIKAAGRPGQFSTSYATTPISDSRTRLDIEFTLEMGGLLGLSQPLMAGSLRKEVDRVSRSIKGMLEQGSA